MGLGVAFMEEVLLLKATSILSAVRLTPKSVKPFTDEHPSGSTSDLFYQISDSHLSLH